MYVNKKLDDHDDRINNVEDIAYQNKSDIAGIKGPVERMQKAFWALGVALIASTAARIWL